MIQLRSYVGAQGDQPFVDWFTALDAATAARVTIALTRMEFGNFSNSKSVSLGVHEYKIDFGPGYRIYFGKDGDRIVILLGGGSKKRQRQDITQAQKRRSDYKQRKKGNIP